MRKINSLFRRLYRLHVGIEKQEDILWNNLKNLHQESEWKCGIYESDKYVETIFEIAEETPGIYHYAVREGELHSVVEIGRWFNPEKTIEMFVLASHLNNILNIGTVTVNADRLVLEYQIQKNLLVPVLYEGELFEQLIKHYKISKDLHWACNKLIHENEEPVLIVADLIKKNQEEMQSHSHS